MALVLVADDAYAFMVAWEAMALASYFLVTTEHRIPEIRRAGFLYLLIAHVGAIAILLCFGVLQGGSGDYTFAGMRAATLSPAWASIGIFLALFGFGAKAGILPLHVWLPEAHPAAPSPVSALMSGVMLKTAIYGLPRVAFDLLQLQLWWWGVVALAFGLVTALFGVIFAAAQTDMKRLLAYSSIENIGDAWGVDCVTAGLQKCLAGPPGAAPLTISDRMADLIFKRRHVEEGLRPAGYRPPAAAMIGSNYFDLAMIMDYWGPQGMNHHTEATTMLYAARESARVFLAEGAQQVFARHALAGRSIVAGIEALGLTVFGDVAHKIPHITGVCIPEGADGDRVRAAMLQDFGVEIGSSFGPLKGKMWRIGTMGYNARKDAVLITLAALEAALITERLRFPRGAGVDAASVSTVRPNARPRVAGPVRAFSRHRPRRMIIVSMTRTRGILGGGRRVMRRFARRVIGIGTTRTKYCRSVCKWHSCGYQHL